VKYVLIVMRADNEGEGGIMALAALAVSAVCRHRSAALIMVFSVIGIRGLGSLLQSSSPVRSSCPESWSTSLGFMERPQPAVAPAELAARVPGLDPESCTYPLYSVHPRVEI